MQKLLKLLWKFISLVLLIISIVVVAAATWLVFGNWYFHTLNPVGGDYYTGLTYATHLAKSLPHPPQGWLSFWNAGVPIIGGYQWLPFYLMHPLTKVMETAAAMDVFSVATLFFFVIGCHLLYWQVSKNHLISFSLSLITLTSQAVYYQLTAAGLITGSSMQWYLPLALYFLLRFFESSKRIRSLLICTLICGIAIIHHPAMSVLFILIPICIMWVVKILIATKKKKQLIYFFTYTWITITVGAIGLIPFIFEMSFGEIASKCDNPQCWGIYPFHLTRWLGILPMAVFGASLIFYLLYAGINKISKSPISLKSSLPLLAGFLCVITFPIAAYFKLIPTLANSIFPRRMFWALLVFMMLITAHLFRNISHKHPRFAWFMAIVTSFIVVFQLPVEFEKPFSYRLTPALITEPPNVVPNYIHQWIIPKYKNDNSLTSYLPEWMMDTTQQYRFDTHNASVIHWWNLVSSTTSTRGYTSSFNTQTANWAHFLQTSLHKSQTTEISDTLLKNRMLFLLDAYAIRYAYAQDYHPLLTEDEELIENKKDTFIKFKETTTSPIVMPVEAPVLLFIGDDEGYNTLMRVLAFINFDSSRAIIVKGPNDLNDVHENELTNFSGIFLYRFSDSTKKLQTYVEKGGQAFVELGSISRIPESLEKFLETKFDSTDTTSWELSVSNQEVIKNVDTDKFSPAKYREYPWKLVTTQTISTDITPLLKQQARTLMFEKTVGKGNIIVSGMNLPYHLLEYANLEEAKMLEALLNIALPARDNSEEIKYVVNRHSPASIEIKTSGAKGIYIKENYHPGWNATVNGKPTLIYPAGLNFMYIPLPSDDSMIINVNFGGTLLSWIVYAMSMISVTFVLIAYIFPRHVGKLVYLIFLPVNKLLQSRATSLQKSEHDEY